MEFPDIIEEEFGCSFCCDLCVHRNEVYSFGDRIHNSHDGVMSKELWEFDHEIDTECIPLCHDLAKWLSQYLYFFLFYFILFYFIIDGHMRGK